MASKVDMANREVTHSNNTVDPLRVNMVNKGDTIRQPLNRTTNNQAVSVLML